MRDSASIIDLLILEELQLENAELIRKGIDKENRFNRLRELAISKRTALEKVDPIKSLKRLDDTTYLDNGKNI